MPSLEQFLPSMPQLLLLAGMGLAIWILWRRSHRHFHSAADEPETPARPARPTRRDLDRDLALGDAPPEIARWQVEMHETARDLKGEIDTKLAVLQLLIQHARQATDRLETAIERAEKLGLHGSLDPLSPIESWNDPAGAATQRTSNTPAPPVDPSMLQTLADQGLDAAAIAQQTGLPREEVERLLNQRS